MKFAIIRLENRRNKNKIITGPGQVVNIYFIHVSRVDSNQGSAGSYSTLPKNKAIQLLLHLFIVNCYIWLEIIYSFVLFLM